MKTVCLNDEVDLFVMGWKIYVLGLMFKVKRNAEF